MSGNVVEWCWDGWSTNVTDGDGGKASVTNPLGAAPDSGRVIRGGGWSLSGYYCMVACRNPEDPKNSSNAIGFRVVRTAN